MQRRNLAGLRVGNQMGSAVYVATVRAFCVACLLVPLCAVPWSLLQAQAPSQDARVTYCVLRGGTPADCAAALAATQPVPTVAVPSQAAECAQAEANWNRAEEIKTLAVYQEHLARFHACAFAAIARLRIEQLQGQPNVAVVVPPAAPDPCSGIATAVALSSRSAQPLSSAESCALKPKDAFKECDKCPEMVVVPAGTFMMGSPKGEQEFGLDYDEGPQHSVTIVRQFAVGRFAVTFDEWDACAADGGCNGFRPADHSGRGRQPVIEVSWDDAQAYLQWLSRKTGKAYRLLSEAEREYVTRAGTTTPYWWGTSISPSQANHGEGGETVPVDSFEPNPWGLYQVHGNISEWVEDCYRDSYTGAPSNGSAWTSGDCSYQVIRGGGFRRYNSARAAARGRHTTVNRVADDRMGGTEFVVNRDRNIGFRVARMLTP